MNSLNLLPDERKGALALGGQLRRWRGAMVVTVIGSCLALVSVGLFDWALADQVESSQATITSWQALSAKRESGQIKDVTTRLNASVSGLAGLFVPLSAASTSPADLLALMPDGLSLTALVINPDGQFTLSGTAATRSSFLALRTALETATVIVSVTTTSTANQREKLPFEYSGQLRLTP